MKFRLRGLVAAAMTPFDAQGGLALEVIPRAVEFLLAQGVSALYVCGSTGEGFSLTGDERRAVAAAYVDAAQGKLPVVVQVGHLSLREARALAGHACEIGATAISANCLNYFPIPSSARLVECVAEVAGGAPELPFYYYHIPSLTRHEHNMPEFLNLASERIPNLVGLKYTNPTTHEYQLCQTVQDGRYDVLWGCDEMLLSALVVGAEGAVGSTYNVAAPLYLDLMKAAAEGDFVRAEGLQYRAVQTVDALARHAFLPALKTVMRWSGIDFGPCRLPLPSLTETQQQALQDELAPLGYSCRE